MKKPNLVCQVGWKYCKREMRTVSLISREPSPLPHLLSRTSPATVSSNLPVAQNQWPRLSSPHETSQRRVVPLTMYSALKPFPGSHGITRSWTPSTFLAISASISSSKQSQTVWRFLKTLSWALIYFTPFPWVTVCILKTLNITWIQTALKFLPLAQSSVLDSRHIYPTVYLIPPVCLRELKT